MFQKKVRRLLWSALVLFAFAGSFPAQTVAKTVTLLWDANPLDEAVAGYAVFLGPVSRSDPAFAGYELRMDAGNVTEQPLNLREDVPAHYLAVVAYNRDLLESDYSEEVAYRFYAIEASAGPHGSLDPRGRVVVGEGDTQNFAFEPDKGYRVQEVWVDGSPIGAVPSYTFSRVDREHSIAVAFAAEGQHSLSATGGGGGGGGCFLGGLGEPELSGPFPAVVLLLLLLAPRGGDSRCRAPDCLKGGSKEAQVRAVDFLSDFLPGVGSALSEYGPPGRRRSSRVGPGR
jgi:hypothetical protein